MKKIIAITIISLLFLILLTPMTTSSAMSGNDGPPWEKPPDSSEQIDGGHRVLKYKVGDNGIILFSVGKKNDRSNVFYFTLKLHNGVFIHYNYFRAPNSDDAETFHNRMADNRSFPDNGHHPPGMPGKLEDKYPFQDLGISLLMKKLREFNETDHDISNYNFGDVDFQRPTVTPISVGGENTGLKIRTATTDGIFGLTFYLVSTQSSGQQKGMTPFEVKYDIEIDHYPFVSSDSFLALENIFSFPGDLPVEPGERKFDGRPKTPGWNPPHKERTVGYDLESTSMYFSWATNVTVDGEDHNVTAEYSGSVSGEAQMIEKMTFIYPQGDSILHDPKIGVSDFMEYAGDAVEFIELLISWSTGLGIGVVLIAAVAVRMKPSKFDWED